MSLFAANILLYGAPKVWWGIPAKHYQEFVKKINVHYKDDMQNCSEFFLHKQCMIDPEIVRNWNIPVTQIVSFEKKFPFFCLCFRYNTRMKLL